jgi:uncharacterized membrane protein YadS
MSFSALFKKEDYWSIWIGVGLLLLGTILFFANGISDYQQQHEALNQILTTEKAKTPFETVAWYDASDKQQKIKANDTPLGIFFKKLTGTLESWSDNPLDAFWISSKKNADNQATLIEKRQQANIRMDEKKAIAVLSIDAAEKANFNNSALNENAKSAIADWRKSKDNYDKINKKYKAKPFNNLPYLGMMILILGIIFAAANAFMGQSFQQYLLGFLVVSLLAIIAFLLANQQNMKALGIGDAAWAITLGLLISNTLGIPNWLKSALSTELYIKTGLILLGAEILLNKIIAIGIPGIFVAWVVTPIILVTTYWFGQKILKISSKTLNITISADMSVCGISAAVATAAACNAKKEELTLAIGLSMVFTSIMMVVMPIFINWLEMPQVLGGAWIGGTIDATGAVVAAGAFLGEDALSVAATIKMIQNVLIGFVAFGVAVYFATKVEKTGQTKIGINEIWKRFPKFIIGFLGASIFFSLLYEIVGKNVAYTVIEYGIIDVFEKNIRNWLFCLAFVSIGLSTNFKELQHYFSGGKPLMLYVCGQLFNLALTLIMAYIMFYLVFSDITAAI